LGRKRKLLEYVLGIRLGIDKVASDCMRDFVLGQRDSHLAAAGGSQSRGRWRAGRAEARTEARLSRTAISCHGQEV